MVLEHDAEKACPALDAGGYRFSENIMFPNNNLKRDGDSKKSHHALVPL
jgi:hypothetical protein